MGEHELQTLILEVLRPLLEALLKARGLVAHVGSDQFIYWERGRPDKCLAPDIYVLYGVDQSRVIDSWRVWETDTVPRFALEVVTSDYRKDYEENIPLYEELGVDELILFDPFPGRNRIRFQIFRRTGAQNKSGRPGLIPVTSTDGDRVRSEVLKAWFVAAGANHDVRLRVGFDPNGAELLPTASEQAETANRKAAIARLEAGSAKEDAAALRHEAAVARDEANAAQQQAEAAERQVEEMRNWLTSRGIDPDDLPT